MSLENLERDLEAKLKVFGVKREMCVQKGLLELFFAIDSTYQETLFDLGLLKGAMKDEVKAQGAPRRTIQEITEAETNLFEKVNLEWLKRLKGKKEVEDYGYGLSQGKLTALEWVLGREGVEI